MVLESGDDADMFFTKITKSGAVDVSFGNAGTLSLEEVFGDAVEFEDPEASLLLDGKLLITGLLKDGFTAYARLTANGKLDTSFGVNGFFVPATGVVNGEEMLAEFSDGNNGFLLVKKVPTGTRFQVFDKDGKVTGSSEAGLNYDFSVLGTEQGMVAVQTIGTGTAAKGYVVLQGETSTGIPVLMRLGANGALDTTFGSSGYMTLSSTIGTGANAYSFDYSNSFFEVRNNAIYVLGVVATSSLGISSWSASVYSQNGATPSIQILSSSDDVQWMEVLNDGRIVEVYKVAGDDLQSGIRILTPPNTAGGSMNIVSSQLLSGYFENVEEYSIHT
jgi:hypothetical protein